VRILVLGAGVIGSVYAAKLLQAGDDVVMLARGTRLNDLRAHGLVLEDSESKQRTELPVSATDAPGANEQYDLVLVPVRSDQLEQTLSILTNMHDGSDVLFFGNTAGRSSALTEALGERVLFGFPAASGTRDGSVIKYVLIRQQRTMLGEPSGTRSRRVRELKTVFSRAGFSVRISGDIDGWLLAHAAFIVPIAFALYRVDVDAARLASDRDSLQLMVRATRQAFRALSANHKAEIPMNLRVLDLWLPEAFAVAYWHKGDGRPARRAVVRRPQPSRARRDDLPQQGPTCCGASHGPTHTRPRHPAVGPSTGG
jgi:2-dehydropantoate 2-reductase